MRAFFSTGLRMLALVYLIVLIFAIVAYKAAFAQIVTVDPYFAIYGLVVCGYILSRFLLSLLYRPGKDHGIEPRVSVVIPAFNEGPAVTAALLAVLELDYPRDKLEVVVVNDGSTDDTLQEINEIANLHPHPRLQVIDFPENRGKRAAIAAGIRASSGEMIAFVDSDSVLEHEALRIAVQRFADPEVGAVAGHAAVLNVKRSWLTRMQAVRYFVAFTVLKGAESVFGAVTCCSGCFSVYRRAAVLPNLEKWERQKFLEAMCTFGDDRSMTNFVLRDWNVLYESRAVSHTIVPHTFRKFMAQQLRWKRSWTRESLVVSRFIWRKHPVAAISTYVGIVLPLLAPIAAMRALFWRPLVDGVGTPLVYILGVYAMALVYGLYYAYRHRRYDTLWVYGIGFVFFYLAFLVWLNYVAAITARRSTWGTRPATHGGRARIFTRPATPAPVTSGVLDAMAGNGNGNGRTPALNGNGHAPAVNGNDKGHVVAANGNGHAPALTGNGNGNAPAYNGNGSADVHVPAANGNGHAPAANGNGNGRRGNETFRLIDVALQALGARLEEIDPSEVEGDGPKPPLQALGDQLEEIDPSEVEWDGPRPPARRFVRDSEDAPIPE